MIDIVDTIKGRVIKSGDVDLYFLRHAQSMENTGQHLLDSPLSPKGVEQAKLATGHFDLVICSPMRRTKETLHYSSITYDELIINHNIREYIQGKPSMMPLETLEHENINDFWKRAYKFTQELESYCKKYQHKKAKILIISHGFFFNGWFRNGSFATPPNAKFIKMN